MPIYEYVCDQCGHHLEALQKISEEPLVYCPECAEAALRKKVSAAAFRLKGTGWYETDFKDGGKEKKESGKDRPDSATGQSKDKDESSGDVKSDSKNNSKTETSSDSKSGSSKGETQPAADSGSSGSTSGSSKPSSGASTGSD